MNTCKVGGIRELTGAIISVRGHHLVAHASSPPEQTTNEEMRRQPQIIISWDGDILGSETNHLTHFNQFTKSQIPQANIPGNIGAVLIMFTTPYAHQRMLD